MSALLGVAAALVDGAVVPGDVEVDPVAGVVVAVGLEVDARAQPAGERAAGEPATRGTGLAVPGFVDLQVNGFAGVDLRRADAEGYALVASELARRGVTAFQPTFHSQSIEDHLASLRTLATVLADPPVGARILPAHLEGPFLSHRFNGAHDPAHLIPPSTEVTDRLLDAGPVGCMTLAPELPGALDVVRMLVERDVVVSLGHTDATADEVRAAVRAGAGHLTHCWNAHRRLSARDPGPAGVALSDDDVTVGLIVDLAHVAAEVVEMTWRAAPGRVAATTDAVAAAGTRRVSGRAAGDVARQEDGTIAGGLAGQDQCLRNLVDTGLDLAAAVDACGGVQRSLLGRPEVRLRPGDPADIAVLDDELRVIRCLVAGVPAVDEVGAA